jgi:PilZ domain
VQTPDDDRRTRPRFPVDLAAQIGVGAASQPGRVRDLSCLGALVEAERLFELGRMLEITLELPDGSLLVWGQVVRARTIEGVPSLGVLFAPLPRSTLNRIRAFLSTLPDPATVPVAADPGRPY